MSYERFKDAEWFNLVLDRPVLVLGAGGTGSWVSLFLSRLGVNLFIVDYDKVEGINMAGQFYNKKDINKFKVDALANSIKEYSSSSVKTFIKNIDAEFNMSNNIVFSCFDNMKARKLAFVRWKETMMHDAYSIFIDLRVTAEQIQIFNVTSENYGSYELHLFDDSEVPDAPCTFKQTTHIAAMSASFAVNFMISHIMNQNAVSTVRDLPFKFEYYAPIGIL